MRSVLRVSNFLHSLKDSHAKLFRSAVFTTHSFSTNNSALRYRQFGKRPMILRLTLNPA